MRMMQRTGRLFFALAVVSAAAWGVFSPRPLAADSFDWANLNGQSWVTPVKSQGPGMCWAFASCGSFEARCKLTRNDPLFDPNISEQQLRWETNPVLDGGDMHMVMGYMASHGVVSEAECPNQTSSPDVGIPPYWPLADGWENRCWKSTTAPIFANCDTDALKAHLKAYGPMAINLYAGNDLFGSVTSLIAAVNSGTVTTSWYCDHGVVLTGYVDDPSLSCGGYWIIKNSWGTGLGTNGYYYSPYGLLEYHQFAVSPTGPVYCTGAMGTATWGGGAGTWAKNGSTNWSITNSTYTAYTSWQNEEIQAQFYAAGSTLTLSGAVIAHGLNITGSGYVFNGGSLTVTGGGISTTQNVTFNAPISIGAPQTWTIGSGNTMTVSGALHTIVSDLTLANNGTLYLGGGIDGGGILNAGGAAPGSILHTGSGTTYITGASNTATNLTVSAGTVVFSGGTLQLGGYAAVGSAGAAAFTQTAGSVSVVSSLSLGSSSTGNGVYGLAGGTLAVPAITKGSGTARLDFGGATLRATAPFITTVPMTLTGTGGNATVDTQAYALTFSGALSGPGGLTKTGAGTLNLPAANSYAGSTTVVNGTLRVTGSIAASNGVNVAGGASLLLLGGAAGAVSVANAATLAGYGTASSVAVVSGGILGSSSDAATWGGTLSSTTLSLVGDSYLNLGNISGYTTTAGICVTGTNGFSTSGTINVNLYGSFSGTGSGAVRLLQYTGSLTGSLHYALRTVAFATQRSTYALGTSSGGGINYLNLDYFVEYPCWTGAGDDVWTTASQTTKNWMLIAAGTTTDYLNNDAVLFDNRVGGSAATVTLGENVSPHSVTFNNSSSVSYTLAGGTAGYCIAGSATLVKSGSGTVTLLTNNTYAGTTVISAGRLQIGNGGTSGAVVSDIVDNGVLGFNRSDACAFAGAISGTGSLSKLGAGTLTLSGNNSYSGTTTISAGAVNVQSSTALGSGNVSIVSGAALQLQGGSLALLNAMTLRGAGIAADGALRNISGANTITGPIVLGSSAQIGVDSGALTLAGVVSGSAVALTKSGAGTLTLSATNTFSGSATLSQGWLNITNDRSLGANGNPITLSGGTLCGATTNAVSLGNSSVIAVTSGCNTTYFTETAAATYTYGTMTGSGTLTVNNASIGCPIFRTDLTTFNGTMYIQNGSPGPYGFLLGATNASGTGTTWVLNGDWARVYLYIWAPSSGTSNVSLGALAGTNSNAILGYQGAGNTLLLNYSIGAKGLSTEYAGHIYDLVSTAGTGGGTNTANPVAIAKVGAGMLTLSGTNLYTGGTTISGGTLCIGGGSTSGSILGNVVNDAVLAFNRSNSYTFSGLISGAGAVSKFGPGTLTLAQANTYAGPTTLAAGALTYGVNNAIGAGAVVVSGGTLNLGAYSGTSAAVTLNSGGITGSGTLTSTSGFTVSNGAVNAVLAGDVPLTKNGTATVTLSKTNTYTGITTVSAGVLAFGANNVLYDNGSVIVSGGTLNVGRFADSVGAVTLASGAITGGIFYAGTLTSNSGFTASSGLISTSLAGNVSLTKTGNGTVTMTRANLYTGTTSVGAGALVFQGTASINAALSKTVTNVSAGTLVLDYSGNTASGPSIAAQINSILTASYNGGANSWASGTICSTLANSHGADSYALGWTNNTTTSAVTVRVTLYGDATLDGAVNIDDLGQVLAYYNQTGTWAAGDFNYDGTVNIYDLGKILANYNKTIDLTGATVSTSDYPTLDGAAVAALHAAGVNVVPEPGTLALLAAGAIGWLALFRRRCGPASGRQRSPPSLLPAGRCLVATGH
jgi:autotransporter-associated beta strand protein